MAHQEDLAVLLDRHLAGVNALRAYCWIQELPAYITYVRDPDVPDGVVDMLRTTTGATMTMVFTMAHEHPAYFQKMLETWVVNRDAPDLAHEEQEAGELAGADMDWLMERYPMAIPPSTVDAP